MDNENSVPFTHRLEPAKFVLFNIEQCPESYLNSVDRDEFFEIIWFEYLKPKKGSGKEEGHHMYLIPPFRSATIPLEDKKGTILAFKREYLEEDDKEYALDVFNLFNLQGQYSFITLQEEVEKNLGYVHKLMLYEATNEFGTFLAVRSLLKVFLLHLIRMTQKGFLNQDVNQKRVYQFCLLLDEFYYKERKASFYAAKLDISEKRLNQILQEKMKKTITQLVHERLLLEAKRKLTTQQLTIKEISFQLNFEDHSYFSRFFKKRTGYSPEEYKNSIAGK